MNYHDANNPIPMIKNHSCHPLWVFILGYSNSNCVSLTRQQVYLVYLSKHLHPIIWRGGASTWGFSWCYEWDINYGHGCHPHELDVP